MKLVRPCYSTPCKTKWLDSVCTEQILLRHPFQHNSCVVPTDLPPLQVPNNELFRQLAQGQLALQLASNIICCHNNPNTACYLSRFECLTPFLLLLMSLARNQDFIVIHEHVVFHSLNTVCNAHCKLAGKRPLRPSACTAFLCPVRALLGPNGRPSACAPLQQACACTGLQQLLQEGFSCPSPGGGLPSRGRPVTSPSAVASGRSRCRTIVTLWQPSGCSTTTTCSMGGCCGLSSS